MLSVRERGEAVATFRWIHVRWMETLAAWTPTTPEMEVKLMFGGHIWDMAQHADMFGKRTHELRMPLQHSIAPIDEFVALADRMRDTEDTAERIGLFYDAALPAMTKRFETYLAATDDLLDAPTVRLLERVMGEQARMQRDVEALRQELLALAIPSRAAPNWLAEETALTDIVMHRDEQPA